MKNKYKFPQEVALILTYRCPMSCKVCNIWQNPTNEDEEIKVKDLQSLPNFKFINITGGEPFIREDIEEIIEFLFTKSKRIVISTSGWYDKKIIKLAEKYPNIGIRISIEGLSKKNDELRGKIGGFDKGLLTLLKLKEMGLKDIGFGITVSDHNTEDMIHLYKLSKVLNIEFATAVVHNSFYFHKFDNYIKNKKLVIKNFELLIDELLKTKKIKNWFRAYFNYGLINYIEGNTRLIPCVAGENIIFIDPKGNILPCNGFDKFESENILGNIKEKSFKEIFQSDKANMVKKKVNNCSKNCWMIGTVSSAIKKNFTVSIKWILINKIKRMTGGLF